MKKYLATVCVALFAMSCTPETLKGFDADAVNFDKGGQKSDLGNDSGGGKSASPEFQAVATHFLASCANTGCHGGAVGNGLKVATPNMGSDQEIYDALTSKTLSADGDPFITAGDPAKSNYLARMVRDTSEAGFMPIGTAKDQAIIDKISTWITAGAKY